MKPLVACYNAIGRYVFRFCTAGVWIRRFGPELQGAAAPASALSEESRKKYYPGTIHDRTPPTHTEHDRWHGNFTRLDCYLGEG